MASLRTRSRRRPMAAREAARRPRTRRCPVALETHHGLPTRAARSAALAHPPKRFRDARTLFLPGRPTALAADQAIGAHRLKKPPLDHRACPGDPLLGRLEEEHVPPRELL